MKLRKLCLYLAAGKNLNIVVLVMLEDLAIYLILPGCTFVNCLASTTRLCTANACVNNKRWKSDACDSKSEGSLMA